jgi:rhodanese-related sulfurtransferase
MPVFIENNILFQGQSVAAEKRLSKQRLHAMKTFFQLRLAAAVRRLGAAILFSVALAASVAAAHAEPLVTTEWLSAHRADANLVVLDVRSAIDGGGAQAYAAAHIPGSVHSDYDKAGWRVQRGGVPFMLPTLAELEKLIGELGIDEDTHLVVVPAGVHFTSRSPASPRFRFSMAVTPRGSRARTRPRPGRASHRRRFSARR